MANTYFQFKQFIIHQDRCAMKVSTEACLLGAWIPTSQPNRILDIGTGSGLLALMLAQRFPSPIDAVEVDTAAAAQASENKEASPWSDRIQIIHQNIFDYADQSVHSYDLIVSNPPFFSGSLRSDADRKNLAKHDTSDFSKKSLAAALRKLLSPEGIAFILYPEYEANLFINEVQTQGLYARPALVIRNQPGGPIFRSIVAVSKSALEIVPDGLNIREGEVHSAKFNQLLKDYYLKL